MQKKEIQQRLRDSTNLRNVRLPVEIGFSIDQNNLSVRLKKQFITKNLQNNNSAFEGWILVLKRWLNKIERVELSWESFELEDNFKDAIETQHYQRFLYRVDRFSESFPWFGISTKNRNSLDRLKVRHNKELILNTPKKRKIEQNNEPKELHKLSESELEKYIIQNTQTSKNFVVTHNLELVSYQLPVGLFHDKVAKGNRIFSGKKSAIDIWGINNKNQFCLFELKTERNKKIGSISEMLFYSWIIHDIQRKLFRFNSLSDEGIKRIMSSKKITCYLLAPETHPLIDNQLIKRMSSNNFGISFMKSKINKDFKFTIE